MGSVPKDWKEINSVPLLELLRKVKFVIAGQGGVAVEALVMVNVIFQPLSNVKVNMSIFSDYEYNNIFKLDNNEFYKQISYASEQRRDINSRIIFNFSSLKNSLDLP